MCEQREIKQASNGQDREKKESNFRSSLCPPPLRLSDRYSLGFITHSYRHCFFLNKEVLCLKILTRNKQNTNFLRKLCNVSSVKNLIGLFFLTIDQ